MRDDANDVARLLELVQVLVDGTVGVVLRVLGERLLLGLEPVLVESTADFIVKVLGPHRLLPAQALRRAHVTDEANHDEFRALDDRHRLARFLLVHLRAGLIDIANDVRHASLEAHERGEVRRLARVILRERLDLTPAALRALLRQETEVTVTRVYISHTTRLRQSSFASHHRVESREVTFAARALRDRVPRSSCRASRRHVRSNLR